MLCSFHYSKKTHFTFFSDSKYDIELFDKRIDPNEDADLLTYQNLLLYSYLRNKKKLNVLHIGSKKLIAFKSLNDKHQFSMLGYQDLFVNKNEILSDNFVLYSKFKLKEIYSHFDLIFLPSSNFIENTDLKTNEIIFDNLKYFLKPDGLLFCSFTNVFQNNFVWRENIFNYAAKHNNLINGLTPLSNIYNDPDLFYLTENTYNINWKEYTGKTYRDFGKAFCINLFFDNKDKILPGNIDDFLYPQNSHKDFFVRNNYSYELFNLNSPERLNIYHLQSLIFYAFIKNNFKKGSKLLCIGNIPDNLFEKLKHDYNIFKIELKDISIFNTARNNINNFISPLNSVEGNRINKFNDYFDFIFAFHNDFPGSKISLYYSALVRNIDSLLKSDGLSLLSFKIITRNDVVYFPVLLSYVLKNTALRISKHIKKENLLAGDEICLFEKSEKNVLNAKSGNINLKESFYNILFKKGQYLTSASKTEYSNKLKEYPVYVFHHLMKCGGTSLFNALDQWFKTIDDNILDEDLNTYVLKKFNTEIFHSDICLRAHFQKDGIYLHQRYPELLNKNSECRIFTFIRDPLPVKISKYYFLKSYYGENYTASLKDSILKDRNFISSLFPCDENNYKEILDRYFFIGIVENFQESFNTFADIIGKRRIKLPLLNTTGKDSQMKEITPEFKKKFRELNELDYKIYEYCINKFNKMIN